MVDVPPEVARKATALGRAGERWIASLPALAAELAAEWQLVIGEPLTGGSAALVCRATTADGQPAVLKLAMPDGLEGNGEHERDLRALRHGQGRGYVTVLRVDEPRRALLLERLGRPIGQLGLSVDDQIDRIAATVALGWAAADDPSAWRSGADQAAFLHDFIERLWQELGRPCARAVIDVALRCADSRRVAHDASTAVVVHADAHPDNVLEDLTGASPTGFKLIDPDAMLSEPAHDLGVVLRDWSATLAADGDAAGRVDTWCARLERATAAPARAIWEWAFTERVSSGLFLLQLGDVSGARFLDVADALSASR